MMERAVELHQSGRFVDAALIYRAIILEYPKHFDAIHLLGVIAMQDNRLDEARNLITEALQIRPNDAAALSNLGIVHLRDNQPGRAYTLFERSVRLQPNSSTAQTNLGTALRQLGRQRDALVPLRAAYEKTPDSAQVCNLLGACLLDSGDARGAVQLFEAATMAEPDNPDGWSNLAIALNKTGEHDRAHEVASKAVAMGTESSAALGALAAVQFDKKQIEASLETYRKAVSLPTPSVQTLCGFANALWIAGLGGEALACLRRATDIDPNNAHAVWKLTVTECQAFYQTEADREISRQAFAQRLDDLHDWFSAADRPGAYAAVGSTQPFYIAYQPHNNRELLSKYGRICEQWMASLVFDTPKADAHAREGVMRIGIISAHIRDHSVWNAITKGWFEHLDKKLFDVSLFHLGSINDEETAKAKQAAARFEDRPKDLHSWAETIASARLDALIYPDIGMDALTTQLASLRLAPVQAASWGHPETTGLPTMDIYISSAAFEPSGAEDNYSEHLVRLPNLGVYVDPLIPDVELPELRMLGLPSDQPLLLCPGMPFKYSPADDVVWARIAAGLRAASSRRGLAGLAGRLRGRGHGRLVFFRSGVDTLDGLFIQRLRTAFSAEKVDFDACVSVIPHLKRSRFFGLMQHSAIMLDTIGFSGFNNALQAVEAGLPVLAREGNFMRGRLASGIMRRMEVPELVASSNEEFIRRAVALTSDRAALSALRAKIAERRSILFRDLEPVRALEKTLAEAIRRCREPPTFQDL